MTSGVQAHQGCVMPEIGPVEDSATVSLLCGDDADPDFQEFINELGRSPASPFTRPLHGSISNSLIPLPRNQTGCFPGPERLAALQDFGLRSSPASTNKRKRKYSSTGDLAHMPSRPSWDTDSSCDSETHKLLADRSSSPNHALSIKRASSSSLACTLMPFSLVKAFPSQDSLSLSDVNRRIQSVAEAAESGINCQSQGSVNSSFLPSSLPNSRSPFRPQIRVVTHYGSSFSDTSPHYSHSFASQSQFP